MDPACAHVHVHTLSGPCPCTCTCTHTCTGGDAEVSAVMEYEKKIAARRAEVARLQQQRDSLLSAQARLKQVQELMTQVWDWEGYGGWRGRGRGRKSAGRRAV